MILSASRRTDIPAYYTSWLLHCFQAGEVLVPNPMNPQQIRRVDLSPQAVEGIVFWTKNPAPLLPRLKELEDYAYYFQFTITSYGQDVEPGVPNKGQKLIPAFIQLAEKLGPDRVIWRYDPIFLSRNYSFAYHVHYFGELTRRLAPYTRRCTISFLDFYRNTARAMEPLGLVDFSQEEQRRLAGELARIAHSCGLAIDACAEPMDLSALGIERARCVDPARFAGPWGAARPVKKDKNQRPECGCAQSVDIGCYDTCAHGCLYCYACHSSKVLAKNRANHCPEAPMLIGWPRTEDRNMGKQLKQNRFETS